jgi:hypothetical protein
LKFNYWIFQTVSGPILSAVRYFLEARADSIRRAPELSSQALPNFDSLDFRYLPWFVNLVNVIGWMSVTGMINQ